MVKDERNSLCPCGSGKKFRVCCGKEKGRVIQFDAAGRLNNTLFEAYVELMPSVYSLNKRYIDKKIDETIKSSYQPEDFFDLHNEIKKDFMGNDELMYDNPILASRLTTDYLLILMLREHFILDHILDNGKTFLDIFIDKNPTFLKTRVMDNIRIWPQSRLGVYEILSFDPETKTAQMQDIFSLKMYSVVINDENMITIGHNDCLFGRLLPSGDNYILSYHCFTFPDLYGDLFQSYYYLNMKKSGHYDDIEWHYDDIEKPQDVFKEIDQKYILLVHRFVLGLLPAMLRIPFDRVNIFGFPWDTEYSMKIALSIYDIFSENEDDGTACIGVNFWLDLYAFNLYDIKKCEIFVATLEYFFRKFINEEKSVTQKMIADKHSVSAGTISKYVNDVFFFFDVEWSKTDKTLSEPPDTI